MSSKPTILIIDEERLPMKYYLQALETQGFQVKQCYNVDTAFEMIRDVPNLAAIVLDIMMPPGKRYENVDTKDGLRTGVLVYKDLRKTCPETPIIVLTNVAEENALQYFTEGPNLRVAMKMTCSPSELSKLVADLVQQKA